VSGSPAPDPPDGPGGLVVIIRNDPTEAARSLADDLDATLAIGGRAAEAALEALQPADDPVDLGRLSAAMRRTEAVQARTRASAAAHLARTVNAELAIHPDTLRRAAHELVTMRNQLERAQKGRGPVEARLARRIRAGGPGGLVVAGIALGVIISIPVGAVVIVVGVVGGSVALMAAHRSVLTTVPLLEAAEAVSRRRWEQVAGRGVDPADVGAVIHRYDPQHRMIAALVDHHPAVRAADRAATVRRDAWIAAWRQEMGGAASPEDDALQPARAEDELLRAATEPSATDRAPVTVVIAAPYADLSDDCARRLHGRLRNLPARVRVIVVLGPDSSDDRVPALDLTDGPHLVDLAGAERSAAAHTDAHADRAERAAPAMANDGPRVAAWKS